ncbi:hypothetical protein LTS18_008646, partial [Coniosporium uncinatum]
PKRGFNATLRTVSSDIAVPVHKSVLCRSPAFQDLIETGTIPAESAVTQVTNKNGTLEVSLHRYEIGALYLLVDYLYLGQSNADSLDASTIGVSSSASGAIASLKFTSFDSVKRVAKIRSDFARLKTLLRVTDRDGLSFHLTTGGSALNAANMCEDADVSVKLSDGAVYVHRDIVRHRCPYFSTLFGGRSEGEWLAKRQEDLSADDRLSVDLPEGTVQTFHVVLDYIYGDCGVEVFEKLNFPSLDELVEFVIDVMALADYLQLDRFVAICQQFIGRYIDVRSVCALLAQIDEVTPVPNFKRAAFDYMSLNLEPLLHQGSLDDLPAELLPEFDEAVRNSQLYYANSVSKGELPTTRSTKAMEDLFERYPGLEKRIELDKLTMAAWMSLYKKGADDGTKPSSTFRSGSVQDGPPSPVLSGKRKPTRDPKMVSTPRSPALKGKASIHDMLFEMDDESEDVPRRKGKGAPMDSSPPLRPYTLSSPLLEPESPWMDHRGQKLGSSPNVAPLNLNSPSPHAPSYSYSSLTPDSRATAQTARPSPTPDRRPSGKPWGVSPLPAASKLDLKNIMAQDDAPKHSGIALGLQLESIASAKKLSQKERKKQQLQAQALSSPEPAGQTAPLPLKDSIKDVAGPAWKTVSAPKLPTAATANTVAKSKSPAPTPSSHSSANASASASASSPAHSLKRSAAPQLTMRQTIAGPHSVHHHPTPTKRTASSPSQQQQQQFFSLANIQYLQAAEKEQIKEFAAPRSLQDIQQQQTFE